MPDEAKNTDGAGETVTPTVTPTKQATPAESEKTAGLQVRMEGLTAEKNRYKGQLDELQKKFDALQAQLMTDSEKAAKKAADEAAAPHLADVARLRGFIADRLEAKRAGLTPEQKALIPPGLNPEQEFDLVDRIAGFKVATPPKTIGGAVNPAEVQPKTYTWEQFTDWQEMASSQNPLTRAKYKEIAPEMKDAYRTGRVIGPRGTPIGAA